MVQFIHLSLLLAATIQPSLAQLKSVTVKFPPHWTVTCYCREECDRQRVSGKCASKDLPKDKVKDNAVIINNFKGNYNGSYCCYKVSHKDKTDQCLNLKVKLDLNIAEVCIELFPCDPDCRELCIGNTKQRSLYGKCSRKCFTKTPLCKKVEIQLDKDTVSACTLRNSSGNINGLHFYQEAKSWIDALEHCQNNKSSLVQITNQTVQDAVNSLLLNKTDKMPDGAWIGLERSIFCKMPIQWMWISGSVAEFTRWKNDTFVDPFDNHCGKIIWVKESGFKWLDADCHSKLPFICQADPT